MKSTLKVLAAVVCMGSTTAIAAQPVLDANTAGPAARVAQGPVDAAALRKMSEQAFDAPVRWYPMVFAPEEPRLGAAASDRIDNAATRLEATKDGAAAPQHKGPTDADAGRQNRFASGTIWRQRAGSRPNSVMGPPVDLMTEPHFIGPPLERAALPMFTSPTADAPARSEPAPPPAPPARDGAPTPTEDTAPDDGPIIVADMKDPAPEPGGDYPGDYPDEDYPDEEYPDEEYPDDEYPDDEGEGELPPPVQVPEAATLLLVGIGLAVMALASRRRRREASQD